MSTQPSLDKNLRHLGDPSPSLRTSLWLVLHLSDATKSTALNKANASRSSTPILQLQYLFPLPSSFIISRVNSWTSSCSLHLSPSITTWSPSLVLIALVALAQLVLPVLLVPVFHRRLNRLTRKWRSTTSAAPQCRRRDISGHPRTTTASTYSAYPAPSDPSATIRRQWY